MKKKIKYLPLGTKFRYPGCSSLWVLLERHGNGLIAEWTGSGTHAFLQQICCIKDDADIALTGPVSEFEVEVNEEDN